MPDEIIMSNELKNLTQIFENLDGYMQLKFVKVVLEKMENGEIEINGKPISPQDIGIPDGYSSLHKIMNLINL